MPGINVSSLNGGDLRRLLKIAHARHDGLLADRLEWEIASRATRVVRPPAAFATLPDDDPYAPDDSATAPDAEPFAPGYNARARASSGRRRVVVLTLSAVAGSLLSATVFWGQARMDGLAALVRDGPHPTRAMSLRTAAPDTDQVVAAPAPEPIPPRPEPVMPQVQAPAATPPAPAPTPKPAVEIAKKEAPAKPVVAKAEPTAKKAPTASKPAAAKTEIAAKKPLAAKTAPAKKALAQKKPPAAKTQLAARDTGMKEPAVRTQTLARADRKPRPPTLDEWLAGTGPH